MTATTTAARPGRTGWTMAATAFFGELERHNDSAWWRANRERYDADVLAPMQELAADVADEFGPLRIHRPHRDVRFSTDKSPYKTSIAGSIPLAAGMLLGVQLSATELRVAAGHFAFAQDQLARYRAAVDAEGSGAELVARSAALADAGLQVQCRRCAACPVGSPRITPGRRYSATRVSTSAARGPPTSSLASRRRRPPGCGGRQRHCSSGSASTSARAPSPWRDRADPTPRLGVDDHPGRPAHRRGGPRRRRAPGPPAPRAGRRLDLAAGLGAGIVSALEDLHEEGDRRALRRRLRATSPDEARAVVEQRIEEELGADVDAADVEPLAAAVLADAAQQTRPAHRVGWSNVRTVVVSVGCNLLALLPAALPFAVIDDWHTAWRWSVTAVAVALVVVGMVWGRAAGISPLVCGLVLVSVGLVEIGVGFVLEAM